MAPTLRTQSWQAGETIWNQGQRRARQVSYLLYYNSGPDFTFSFPFVFLLLTKVSASYDFLLCSLPHPPAIYSGFPYFPKIIPLWLHIFPSWRIHLSHWHCTLGPSVLPIVDAVHPDTTALLLEAILWHISNHGYFLVKPGRSVAEAKSLLNFHCPLDCIRKTATLDGRSRG